MERNSPINSVYLVALATIAISANLTSFYSALIYGVAVLVVYYISLSIVSMVDKITDNHVRFVLYTFIASALVIILKVVTQYIGIQEVVFASQNLETAILPCMILAIYPIYFESTYSPKNYVITFIVIGAMNILMFVLLGSIVEIFGNGTIAGVGLNIQTFDFFNEIYGAFFLVASLAVLFNIVRRAIVKKNKRFQTLVEKYKIIIRDLQEEHPEIDYTEFSGKGGKE